MYQRGGGVAALGEVDAGRTRQKPFSAAGPRLAQCIELPPSGGRDCKQCQAEGRRVVQRDQRRLALGVGTVDFEITAPAGAFADIIASRPPNR